MQAVDDGGQATELVAELQKNGHPLGERFLHWTGDPLAAATEGLPKRKIVGKRITPMLVERLFEHVHGISSEMFEGAF